MCQPFLAGTSYMTHLATHTLWSGVTESKHNGDIVLRNKSCSCPVSVWQEDAIYCAGGRDHIHPTKPPYLYHITRKINYHHYEIHPRHPQTLDFAIMEDHLQDGVLHEDIHVDDACHLIFATNLQLSTLKPAKICHIDATFHNVWQPFTHWIRRSPVACMKGLYLIMWRYIQELRLQVLYQFLRKFLTLSLATTTHSSNFCKIIVGHHYWFPQTAHWLYTASLN